MNAMKNRFFSNRIMRRKLAFWCGYFRQKGQSSLVTLSSLTGIVKRIALVAACSVWGTDIVGQELHFSQIALDSFGIADGSKALIDLDADGDQDFLLIQGSQLKAQYNNPVNGIVHFDEPVPNPFGVTSLQPFGITSYSGHIAVADLSGDGALDIVFKDKDWGDFSWLDLSNDEIHSVDFDYWSGVDNFSFYVADLDSDGQQEIHINSKYFQYLCWISMGTYYNTPIPFHFEIEDGSISTGFDETGNTVVYDQLLPENLCKVLVGKASIFNLDIDNDGLLDLIHLNELRNEDSISLVNKAQLSSNNVTYFDIGLADEVVLYGSMDLDGDGDLDLIGKQFAHIRAENQAPIGLLDTFEFNTIGNAVNSDLQYYGEPNVLQYIKTQELLQMHEDPDGDEIIAFRLIDMEPADLMLREIRSTRKSTCPYDMYFPSSFSGAYPQYQIVPGDSISLLYQTGNIITDHYYAFEGLVLDQLVPFTMRYQVFDGHLWSDTCVHTNSLEYFSKKVGVRYDINNNGIIDSGEPFLPSANLLNQSTNEVHFSGMTYIDLPNTSFGDTITATFSEALEVSPDFIVAGTNQANGMTFLVSMPENSVNQGLNFYSYGPWVPGFSRKFYITARNGGPIPESPKLKVFIPDGLEVNLPYITGDTIYLIPEYASSIQQIDHFVFYLQVPAATPIGTTFTIYAELVDETPGINEITPQNNIKTLTQTVVGAFDPNNKIPHRGIEVRDSLVLINDKFEYTINFQNTGNFPADSVAVLDTLDTKFDPTTIVVTDMSHQMYYRIGDNGALAFYFPSINLPDSTSNESASHGFVQYQVQPKQVLIEGDQLFNTAHIFFDYNEAVVTNTAITTITSLPVIPPIDSNPNTTTYDQTGKQIIQTTTQEEQEAETISILPNPNNGHFTVRLSNNIQMPTTWQIYDLSGKMVHTQMITAKSTLIHLELTSGTYYCVVVDENGVLIATTTLVIEDK
jgi:uncharacterized repeat protein (TIGR01451 family)